MKFAIIFLIGALTYMFYKWLLSRYRRMRILKENHIPGPTPNIIYGQMREYNATPNVIWDSKMIEEYGPICGYYIGAKPVILIADPDLAKQIEVKQMTNYQERPRRVPGGINPDPMRAKMLGNLPVPEWKSMKKTLSKSFSSSMMKVFTPIISRLIEEELMNHLHVQMKENTERVELNIYPLFQNFTFELISQTGFSTHANFGNDGDLKTAVEEEFSKSATSTLTKLLLCSPEVPIFQRIRVYEQWYKKHFGKSKSSKLQNLCRTALQNRMSSEEPGNDILQVMLDSPIRDDDEKVLANSILFYEAAYETLSAGLAFTMHLLTINEDVQKKVRDEVRSYLQDNGGHICAENISNLKYLDAVIKESLRMYPPQTTFISRSGVEDYVYEKNDITICTVPKGVQIQIALFQMHNSPEFWDEPEIFKPERHLQEEKDPLYDSMHQPFGKGRRKCIGYSYAKLVMPLVLVTILSKYTFSPSPKTEEKLTLLFKTATMTPKNGCFGEIQFDPIVLLFAKTQILLYSICK